MDIYSDTMADWDTATLMTEPVLWLNVERHLYDCT